MNEEQYQYVYNAYRANPYAFTNEQVDQIANAAKRLNVDFGRDPMHEEATIGSVLGNVLSGVVQGFTTLEVGDRPVTAADQIANNIGYLLGFVGFVPGITTAGRFLTRKAISQVINKKSADTVVKQFGRQATIRTAAGIRAATANRITSVPFLVANKITDGIASTAAARSATDFFIKKGLQKQTVSKIGDIAKEGFRMGVASSVSSWQYGVDQMAASFIQGGVTGAGFRGIANFVNLGSEGANKFVRIAADTIYSGGMSTLAGDPMPVQVYNYALGALFGSMERPLKEYQAAEFLNKHVNVHSQRNMRRKAVDAIETLDEYKDLPDEVKDIVKRDIDIHYGSEAKIAEEWIDKDSGWKIREGELIISEAVRQYAAEKGIKPEDVVRHFGASNEFVKTVEESLEQGKTEEEARADGHEAAKNFRKEIDELIIPKLYQGDPLVAGDFIPRLKAEEEAYKPSIGAFESSLARLARRAESPSEFFRIAELEVSKFLGGVIGDKPEDVERFRNMLNDIDPTIKFSEKDDQLIRKTINTYRQAKEKKSGYISANGRLEIARLTDIGQDVREVGGITFMDALRLPLTLVKRITQPNEVVINAETGETIGGAVFGNLVTQVKAVSEVGGGVIGGLPYIVRAMANSASPLRQFLFSPVKAKGQATIIPSLISANTREERIASVGQLKEIVASLDKSNKGVSAEYERGKRAFLREYKDAFKEDFNIKDNETGKTIVTGADYYDLMALNNIRAIEEVNKATDPDTGKDIYIPFGEIVANPDRFVSSSDELVKRMQGLADSNFSLNSPYFDTVEAVHTKTAEAFPSVTEDGGFRYAILNDKNSSGELAFGDTSQYKGLADEAIRIDNTDGALLMRPDVFDAIARSAGLEDGIGSIKLTITYSNEVRDGSPLGMTFHKVSAIRMGENEAAALYDNNLSFLTFASGVKQTGFRDAVDYKVDVDGNASFTNLESRTYKAPIESIRVNVGASEHLSQINNTVRVVSQMADDIADPVVRDHFYRTVFEPSLRGDAAQTSKFLEGNFEGVDIDRVDASELISAVHAGNSLFSPEQRGFVIREILRKNLPDPENDYSILAERENSRSMKTLQDLMDTDHLGKAFIDVDANTAAYIDDRIRAYFHTRTAKPLHDVGGQSIFTSLDAFTQRHLSRMSLHEMKAGYVPAALKKALYNGTVPQGYVVFNNAMRNQKIKWLDGKKVRLEDAWNEYLSVPNKERKKKKEMENLLTFLFVRVPNDSAAGVRPLKFAGFGQRRGSGMVVNAEELKRMGGADIDIDKAFWYQDIDKNGTGTGPIMDYFRSTTSATAAEPYDKPPAPSKQKKIASLFSASDLHYSGAVANGSQERIGVYANLAKRLRNYLYDLVGGDRSRLSEVNKFLTQGINSSADGINRTPSREIRRLFQRVAGRLGIRGLRERILQTKEIEGVFERGLTYTYTQRALELRQTDMDDFNHPRQRAIIELANAVKSAESALVDRDPATKIPSVSTSSINRIIDQISRVFSSNDPDSQITRFLTEGFGGSAPRIAKQGADFVARTVTSLGSMVALDRRGRAAIAEMEATGMTRDQALVAIENIQSMFKGDSGFVGRVSNTHKTGERIEDVFNEMTKAAEKIQQQYGSSARLYFEMIARGGTRLMETPTEGAMNVLRNVPESKLRAVINRRTEEIASERKIGLEEAERLAVEELVAETTAKIDRDRPSRKVAKINDWAGISKQTNIDYADAVNYVASGQDNFAERAAEPRFSETGTVEITKNPETDLPKEPVRPEEVEAVDEFTSRIGGEDRGAKFTDEQLEKISKIKEIFYQQPELAREMMSGGGGAVIKSADGKPITPELWTPRELDMFIKFFNKTKGGGILWDFFSKGTGDLPRFAYNMFPDPVINYMKPFDGELQKAINKRVITPDGIKVLPVREFYSSFDKVRGTASFAHERTQQLAAEEKQSFNDFLGFLEQGAFKEDAQEIAVVASVLRELGNIRKINEDGSLGAFKKGYTKTIEWKRFKDIEKIYKRLLNKEYVASIPQTDASGNFLRGADGKILFKKKVQKITGKDLFGDVNNPNYGVVNKGITNFLRKVYNKIIVNKKGAEKHIIYRDKEKGIVDLDATIKNFFEMIRRNNDFMVGIDGLMRLLHAQSIEVKAMEIANRRFPTKRGSKRYNRIVEQLYKENPFEYEKTDVFDAGMTNLQKVANDKNKTVKIGQVGEINMFAYFPHNNYDTKVVKKYIQELEVALNKATSETERNRLKIKISQLYGTAAAPENAFTQGLRDAAFSTPRNANGDIVIVKPRPIQSRGREPMPGYDASERAIKTYTEQVVKGYYDTLTTVIANHEITRFEERAPMGEYTRDWAEWGRTYLRTILGHDTMYSDEYLKRNPKLHKSAAYYTSDRYWFDRYSEVYLKRFDKARYDRFQQIKSDAAPNEDWTRHPEVQRFASKVRSFSTLEGKWNMMTLLAQSRSLANNVVGGNAMTLVSTGFKPWLYTFQSAYWKSINPEWKSFADLKKFAAEHGAIESYITQEVNLNPSRFSSREAKNFAREVSAKLTSRWKEGKDLSDSELISIAKRNGLSEDFVQTAAWFMRASERDLRTRSFMAHYFKGREVLGANKEVIPFDDPSLINYALKGVKGTQFLYNAAERPIASASSIGKIFSRFQLWSWNSIRFRRDVYKAARESGYQEGTEEFERYKRVVTADLLMFGLGSAVPFSMFESVIPAPFNYLQDLSDYFFGDESDKEKAFFGTLPYPLNVTGIVLPPSSRIFTAMTALAGGDVDRFVDYHIWTMIPFGLMGRNIVRTAENPVMAVDNLTGFPSARIGRQLRELREQEPMRRMTGLPFSRQEEQTEE